MKALLERTEARGKLRESEKRLSQNIYERGVDDAGFGRIRSRGDQALFGGKSTQDIRAQGKVTRKEACSKIWEIATNKGVIV